MVTDSSRSRWYTEPLLTGAILLGLYAVWQLSYSANVAASGVPISQPYTSGLDFAVRMVQVIAWVGAPIAIWAGFVIGGNWLVRHRRFASRALVAFAVAAIPCVILATWAFLALARSDGWRGLAVISLIIPLMVPVGVLVVYCIAGLLLSLRDRPRPARPRAVPPNGGRPGTVPPNGGGPGRIPPGAVTPGFDEPGAVPPGAGKPDDFPPQSGSRGH